jgi:alkanesulfonate monooxygenase SsuD/methylene tetrahydromethanopterin reductase-like flavin-dependent oxidoreductase (luciferase family)
VKIGLQIYYFGWPGGTTSIGPSLAKMARIADDAGFASLWVMDHLFQLGRGFGPAELARIEEPMLEGYTTIAYLAGVTERMKLGLMMTSNVYRYPGMLIKAVTTLDVLSNGRAYLGIGTGWNDYEAKALGIPFPTSTGELVDRLEETLQIAKHMWLGDAEPFNGRFHRLEHPLNSPQPVSKPHPPIMVGMWVGATRMMGLTARYADACNLQIGTRLPGFPPYIRERYEGYEEYLREKLSELDRRCEEVGRSPAEVERTVLATIKLASDAMDAAEVIKLCDSLKRLGIDHVIFNMPNVHELRPIEILGTEVIPRMAEM